MIHLGERDCSVQRRYQKLIEEAPAPGLPERLRTDLREAGVRFAGGSTIAGPARWNSWSMWSASEFYFLEMNARIQVEHPVTEAVTGIDLVEQQIRSPRATASAHPG